MYAADAKRYILKLINIQNHIEKKGYRRIDQAAVRQAKEHLRKYLEYYKFDSDEKMRGFFERNHDKIKTLIPTESYPGFKKLMNEFINLQNHNETH
ncbi:MAG: hypothetical protein JZU47_10870 [Prolixibacteraceae bacterium]|nr:hypothetical protein [Prolixibacteraceae bacterium]